jgi:hypothetical protein
VDPPNWWVPYSRNPVQVLLTGTDLKGVQVTAASPGFKVDVRQTSDDGRYLFVYLDIDQGTKPGKYRFDVKGESGAAAFELVLEAPRDPRGRFQGITPDDIIYLLMPDRFANGDPANDTPPGVSRPANRGTVNAYHGGDLRGVRERLPYLKELGVTGIWMTPVYKNTAPGGAGAYHGYATVDFYDVGVPGARGRGPPAGAEGRSGPGGEPQRPGPPVADQPADADLVQRPQPPPAPAQQLRHRRPRRPLRAAEPARVAVARLVRRQPAGLRPDRPAL